MMADWGRCRTLDAEDRALLREAVLLLILVRIGLGAVRFPVLCRWLDRWARYGTTGRAAGGMVAGAPAPGAPARAGAARTPGGKGRGRWCSARLPTSPTSSCWPRRGRRDRARQVPSRNRRA